MPDLSKLKALVPEGEPEWRWAPNFPGSALGSIRANGQIAERMMYHDAIQVLAMRDSWRLVMAVVKAAKDYRGIMKSVPKGTPTAVRLDAAFAALEAKEKAWARYYESK